MRFAIAALALVATIALGAEAPPAPGKPRDFRVADRVDSTLANGLKITFVEFGTIPKTSVRAITRVGNLNEGTQTWLADLTGELLKEGAGNRSASQLAEDAANMGGQIGVGVGPDQTSVSLDVLSEHGADAVALIADLLRRPQMPESELPRIKRDFVRQLALARTEPDSLASEAFLSLIYPQHPYGRAFPTEAQVEGYAITDVRRFFDDNFGAARTHIYVAGRFDRATLEQAITRAFGDWAAGPAPLISPPQPVSKLQLKVVDRPGSKQSTIYLGLPIIDPSQSDYITAALMNSLLGGGFSSRIVANIREDKGYAYSPSSGIDSRYRASVWSEQADVPTEVTASALKEIYYEIDRLQREVPPAAELKGIQNYRAGVFVLQNSTPAALLAQLAYIDLHGLPADYLTRYVERVYSITPEQVSAAARNYIRPADMTLVVVGDAAKVRPQLATLPQLKGLTIN